MSLNPDALDDLFRALDAVLGSLDMDFVWNHHAVVQQGLDALAKAEGLDEDEES